MSLIQKVWVGVLITIAVSVIAIIAATSFRVGEDAAIQAEVSRQFWSRVQEHLDRTLVAKGIYTRIALEDRSKIVNTDRLYLGRATVWGYGRKGDGRNEYEDWVFSLRKRDMSFFAILTVDEFRKAVAEARRQNKQ